MNQLLEASNWAPTHGKTEPWRYVVIGQEHMQEMLDLTIRVGLPVGLAWMMSTPRQSAIRVLSAVRNLLEPWSRLQMPLSQAHSQVDLLRAALTGSAGCRDVHTADV